MELKRVFLCVLVCLLAAACGTAASGQEAVKDQAICYTTWDQSYFYVAFRVDCPDVVGSHFAPNKEVVGDDSVSIYVETDNKRAARPTANCFSMTVSAAGGSEFRKGTDQGEFELTPVWTFKYGTSVQGTVNNSDDVDMGFSAEIAIPWELMGGRGPQLGDMITFNVLIRRHGEGGGSFISLSPQVESDADIACPDKWLNLLFAAYSFGAVMPGGGKVISPKAVARPPLIDGAVNDREWSKKSSFAMDLPMEEGFVYEAKYPIQKLVLGHYFYDYQRDPRRQAPLAPLASNAGGFGIQHFPLKSAGPWFSSDRVQWHKDELTDMVSCGLDIVLPVYRGDRQSKTSYAAKGLDCLVSAITELRAEGKPHPLVAMCFDTAAMSAAYGGQKPSLKDDEAKRTFYGMVKDFFDRVPADLRAWTQTGKPNAGRMANLVFLQSPDHFSDYDAGFLNYASECFERDFGLPLAWVASQDYKAVAKDCDGFCAFGAGLGWKYDDAGRIRIASVGAGFDNTANAPDGNAVIRSRMGGQSYEGDWTAVLGKNPQWVLCDTWNRFGDGSDLCASREYGRKYLDLTRAQVGKFKNGKEFDVQYLRCDIPKVVSPKQLAKAELTIRNTGTSPWRIAEGYAIGYRWCRSGRFYGESKARRPMGRDIAPGESVALDVGIATVDAQGASIPDGDYEIRFEVVRQSDGKWLSALGAQPLIMPITIGQTPEWRATWLACSAPVMMESGQDYPVKMRVRNDGSATWPKGVVKLSCKLMMISNYTHDNPDESASEVPIRGVRVLLEKDCKPGDIAEFAFPLNLLGADKKLIPAWKPENSWSYQLRFDLFNGKNWFSEIGSSTLNRIVDIFEADYGARLADSNVPAKLTAGQTFDAKVVVRNTGARTWDRKKTAVGYHWYHLDGLELQWDGTTSFISQSIKPGWPLVTAAQLKAPEYDGQYVLVWDVSVDGQWVSTLPLTRGGDLLPVFVEVTGGRLAFADLTGLYDVTAMSPDTNRALGDFDGAGASFPAEYIPPDAPATETISRVFPSGYKWDTESRPDGRISFLYPEKTADAKSALACSGQKVTIDRGKYVAVHVLGASSAGDATGEVSINYESGAEPRSITMSDWATGPKDGERVGCAARHRHSRAGDDLAKPCYLYHYTLKLDPTRTLTSITLPKNAAMKVVAVTFERASLPPSPAADSGEK